MRTNSEDQPSQVRVIISSISSGRSTRSLWRQVNEIAESLIEHEGEREALAYRCMITRDLCHILELYCTCMRKDLPEASADAPSPASTAPQKPVKEETKMVPFSEWLFIGTE